MAAIEKIEVKTVPLPSKVILERSEYESLAIAAKKYVAAEKGVNAFWSKRGLFPDAPTWKPW